MLYRILLKKIQYWETNPPLFIAQGLLIHLGVFPFVLFACVKVSDVRGQPGERGTVFGVDLVIGLRFPEPPSP